MTKQSFIYYRYQTFAFLNILKAAPKQELEHRVVSSVRIFQYFDVCIRGVFFEP